MALKDHAAAGKYLLKIAGLMRLSDYTFALLQEPEEDERWMATVSAVRGRKLAHIQLNKEFFDAESETQRLTIVHELLHVHFACSDNIVTEVMHDDARKAWEVAMEYGVDEIARTLAPFMPLPR